MRNTITAEQLFQDLKNMPTVERQRFFEILTTNAFRDDDLSHETLFGHLTEDEFTAQEAAEYLEVSMSTFRRHVNSGRLNPSNIVGRNQLFATRDLKAFKKVLKSVKSTG